MSAVSSLPFARMSFSIALVRLSGAAGAREVARAVFFGTAFAGSAGFFVTRPTGMFVVIWESGNERTITRTRRGAP